MNDMATADRSISVTIFLTLLMIFLGISAATGGLNKAETTDLSDQNACGKPFFHSRNSTNQVFKKGPFSRILRSLQEITTPAPSLTTVLCRAGERDTTANWVMEEHLTKPRPRSPAVSVQVARQ